MRNSRIAMLLSLVASALLSSGCVGTMEPQGSAISVPTSIDATGQTDVTDPLNAWFASVPDSSVVRLAHNGRYRVEGTLLFVDRHALTIDGNGATIFATTDGSGVTPPALIAHLWPRLRSQFHFQRGSDIVVRNLTVRGANPNAGMGDSAYVVALEAQHGFNLVGVQGVELDHVTVTDPFGDFVYFGATNGQLTTNARVHDSHFERNGRQGMSFTGAENVLIERNEMSQIRRAHFDLEPNLVTDVIRGVTITNNHFGPGRLLFLASAGAGGTIENIEVRDNTFTGKAVIIQVIPPAGSRRSGFRIINNVSDTQFGSTVPLMQFTRVDGLEVRGNQNPLQTGRSMVGVGVTESCGVTVQGNNFPGGVESAIDSTAVCTP